jgi:transposase-like protein
VDVRVYFLDDLRERRLRPLLLSITDSGDGLIGAVERTLPRSPRQRCLIRRARTFLAEMSFAVRYGREQLTSYLRFPSQHHRRTRHSDFIERTFADTCGGVNVIGPLPGIASMPEPLS